MLSKAMMVVPRHKNTAKSGEHSLLIAISNTTNCWVLDSRGGAKAALVVQNNLKAV
jgi:hypothetical protein